jgi:hypothetical protein
MALLQKANIFLIFLTLFIASGAAITIPADQDNGIYTVEIIDGEEIFTKVSELDIPTTELRSLGSRDSESVRLQARFDWPGDAKPYCNDDYLWSDNLYHGAYDAFWDKCYAKRYEYFYGKSLYAKYGQAVAYMCNYSNSGNPCQVSEFADAVNWISGACKGGSNGWKQAGM